MRTVAGITALTLALLVAEYAPAASRDEGLAREPYVDALSAFSLRPPARWTRIEPAPPGIAVVFRAPDRTRDATTLTVCVAAIERRPEDLMNDILDAYKKRFPNGRLVRRRLDRDGRAFEIVYAIPTGDGTAIILERDCVADKRVACATFTTTEEDWRTSEALFTRSARTLRIVDEEDDD